MAEDQFQEAEKATFESDSLDYPADTLPVAHMPSTILTTTTSASPGRIFTQAGDTTEPSLVFQEYSPPDSIPFSVLQTTTNSLTSRNSEPNFAGQKRTMYDDLAHQPLKFVAYDTSRFENKPAETSNKRRRKNDAPATLPFRCAGCRKQFVDIEHHFRRLRSNTTSCRAQRFRIKSEDGQWGEELAYAIWAGTPKEAQLASASP